MLYFLNLDGTMTLAEPQRVFQGSNNVNTVYVLSAIAPPTALEISFTLPSGLTTAYYPMIYNGTTDEYTVPNTTTTVYLRSFLLTSNITAEVGTVGVSVNAVYSNADGTTGNQTSFTGSFNVEYSSIPESVTTGTADELQQALDLLSQYYTQQQAIITGGTNGEYLQSQGNNRLPVWTSLDMDFVTVNRAQSFSEEQKTQARTNIGAASQTEMSTAADNINTLNTTVDALEQVALTANQKALVVNEYNKQLNLFKNKKLPTTYEGVTLTPIGLSSYKITGTNTASTNWGFNNLADVSDLDPNKTYTLKLTVVSGTGECGIQGSTTAKQVTKTGASLSNIYITIPGSQAFSDYVVTMMLVEGSTAADYIPYYGDIIHQAEIDNSVVKYSSGQSLTNEQKAQARTNIGALSSIDLSVWSQLSTDEHDLNALADKGYQKAYISQYSSSTANIPEANTQGNVISFRNFSRELTQLAMDVQLGKVYYRASATAEEFGTWKEVDTIAQKGDNYVVYTSGLKIQWGIRKYPVEVPPGSTISQTISLPIAMTTTNYQAFGNGSTYICYYTIGKKADRFVMNGINVGTSTAYTYDVYGWIVIGY